MIAGRYTPMAGILTHDERVTAWAVLRRISSHTLKGFSVAAACLADTKTDFDHPGTTRTRS